MCGIVGIYNSKGNKVNRKSLEVMNNSLYHRGPDDGRLLVDDNVGFGHRRLAIIDLEHAAQPMTFEKSGLWIIYNGEVYNYIEIKEELKKLGYRFKTNSDTEVVLCSYIHWGEDCFNKFNGMWAIAIYDSNNKSIILNRDRFGIKPLYFYYDSDIFMFASELKAFLAYPDKEIEIYNEGLEIALRDPFDLEASGKTILKNIHNLLPAHTLKFDGKSVKISQWWDTADNIVSLKLSKKEKKEKFLGLLEDSCRLRLRADVPIATSLSGGLDSSSIVAILSKISGTSYTAYTHTFSGTFLDESIYSEIVSKTTNTPLKKIEITEKDLLNTMDDILFKFESIYGGSPDSAYRVYKAQHDDGIKVTLDGHGADEMLAGYNWYITEALKDIKIWNFRKYVKMLKLYRELTLNPKAKGNILKEIIKTTFLYNFLKERYKKFKNKEYDSNTNLPKKWTHLQKKLYKDFHYTVLPRILKNFDLVSMANSVEVRMPFMDYRIVNFVFSLDNDDKIDGNYTKSILRYAMEGILDDRVRLRKDKIGFNSPLIEWLQKDLKPWVEDILNSGIYCHELIDKSVLSDFYYKKILKNNFNWGDALEFWKKISALKIIKLFMDYQERRKENA